MPAPARDIRFLRLTEVPPEAILEHMRDPRVAEHMPLLTFEWTPETVTGFVAAKEACWARDGLGHWAFVVDGAYVGWGGFQKEGEEWDFGLVLKPEAFGLGLAIAARALEFARTDARLPYVTFLLPPSRRHLGALRRLGAEAVGQVDYAGESFLKFRLETG
jgi:hypothetical protein